MEPFTEIDLSQWLPTAARHQADGSRLVQITGTARADHFEIMISFDQDYRCTHYRTRIPRDHPELPSISGIFPAAFTYENELKDLFGFSIPGLAVDYGGHFLRTKTKIPFSGDVTLNKTRPGAKKAAAKKAAAKPATKAAEATGDGPTQASASGPSRQTSKAAGA